jgi:type I restriction enzyme, S subunit
VGVIPDDREVCEAANFYPFITSGSRGWAKFYSERGSAFVRITNLSRECIYPDLSDLKLVELPPQNSEAHRTSLCDGDLLISITADIGIIGYVTRNVPRPAYINQHIACVRFPFGAIDSRFVSYFLASHGPQRRFAEMTDVGAKLGINLTTVSRLKLVSPPEAEQRAIAEALGDMDAEIAALEAKLAKARNLKRGMMQELLTGRIRLV